LKKYTRIVSVVLVLSLFFAMPVFVAAETEPRASAYFSSHDTFLTKTGPYCFQVWFDVTGVGGMDILGVSTIEIDRSADGENWTTVRTYSMEDYPNMICENTCSHTDYVTYCNVVRGNFYRAYITFYAKQGNGEAELYRMTPSLYMSA
jgi:hypothetical protein